MTSAAKTITRLPSNTGRSGWEALSPRRQPVRSVEGDVKADWLIVGAGFAGLSAARRLAQIAPGDRIVVVDASELAVGTSGRNSGFMIDVPHTLSSGEYSQGGAAGTALEMAQNRAAIAFASEIAAEFGMPRATFDPAGKINGAASTHGLKLNEAFAASLHRAGERFEMLDAAAMRELSGSSYYLGGVRTPGAVLIQPADYIRGLAFGVSPKADIYENSPIVELKRTGGTWVGRTPKGSVSAPKVILGVNGHIQSFGHFVGRLLHIFAYASMTAPLPTDTSGRSVSGAATWGILPADPMGATIRKIDTPDGARIVLRTRYTCDQSLKVSDARVAAMAAEHRRSFDARFPHLKAVPFDYSWSGALCLSRNHAPAFGEVEEGLFSACCENGLGTVKSTLAGMMAADLATGTRSEQLARYRDQPIPSRLPPEPFTSIGANAVIRWQELRAGRER